MQPPLVLLTYADFISALLGFDFFVTEAQHNEFTIVPSVITQMEMIGNHMQGQSVFNNQMSQLNQSVIFTSGFQDALGVANLSLLYRDNNHEAASFVFPVPDNLRNGKNYPQTNYEFFVVREVAQQKENLQKIELKASQNNQEESREQHEPHEYRINEYQKALNQK
jgi:hypothetical protein